MKTTNDLKLLIEENKINIKVLTSEIGELYKVTPYTDRVAKQVKDKYKKIEEAQAKIAELRQSIVYLESTPPHGILASYEATKERLSAIEREIGSVNSKELKAAIRSARMYSKAKTDFLRMSFLVN